MGHSRTVQRGQMPIDEQRHDAMLANMNKDAKLLSEVLKLPAEARAALAVKLIDSLDSEVDQDAEDRWSEEIERRLAEVRTDESGRHMKRGCGTSSRRT